VGGVFFNVEDLEGRIGVDWRSIRDFPLDRYATINPVSALKASCVFQSGLRLEITQGDLTEERVDAIVNAANSHLQHGGGIAGAIVRKGGLAIQQESDAWVQHHGSVSHANPAYTSAGQLPCRFVIHAVGPIWGEGEEDEKLAQAIYGSLKTAEKLGLESIALPAISTGIFGFPKERAANVFHKTILDYIERSPNSSLRLVRLTLWDTPTLELFLKAFPECKGAEGDDLLSP